MMVSKSRRTKAATDCRPRTSPGPAGCPGGRRFEGLVAAAALGLALGCADGDAPSDPGEGSGAGAGMPADGSGEPAGAPAASDGDGAGDDALPVDPFTSAPPADVAAETRVTRLTHRQYENTLQDLFGIDDSLNLTFAPDALNGFTFDTSNAFRVDARLGPQYREAAERLAERVVSDDELFGRVVPCDAADAATCSREFLSSFGERAFRRPLQAEELDALGTLFDGAGALVQSGNDFRDGVKLSLEAILQSPQFLYRVEESRAVDDAGRVALGNWEVASRLSYYLYDSMPDPELFEAARAGELSTAEQVAGQARRMLTQPRVLDKLVSFHAQAWDFGRFSRISPDPATYPEVPNEFVPKVRRAAELFVENVLGSGGGLKELLTAPYAFADESMLPLYGVEAGGAPGFQRVDFSADERKGLLMQVGFLAANSYSIRTDPIHRGLFVVRHLLCRDIPDPPPGASTTPLPETDEPIDTTRQEISVLTGQSYCPSCHTQINPPGFAFEGFDAAGQVRSEDGGFPVDTAAEMLLDGRVVRFADAAELVELLAASSEAHRCYSRRWIEFSFGRPLALADVPLLDELAARSLPVADIIATIVTSNQFSSLGPSASFDAALAPEEAP